eukprot:398942-Rhodomonas_salina.2
MYTRHLLLSYGFTIFGTDVGLGTVLRLCYVVSGTNVGHLAGYQRNFHPRFLHRFASALAFAYATCVRYEIRVHETLDLNADARGLCQRNRYVSEA